MRLLFWGARGSCPIPLDPFAVRKKLTSLLHRIKPEHLVSDESRLAFLTTLPEWLYGTVGGNTPCVEILGERDDCLVFDAGSGIIALGNRHFGMEKPPSTYHIFFTHFHYDHIQGFPFFGPAFHPAVTINFYSPVPNFEQILRNQMRAPYFPITMEGKMTPNMHFHTLEGDYYDLEPYRIRWHYLHHPGGAHGYRVDCNNRSFGYVTDVELMPGDFERSAENVAFFDGLHSLVLDTPYTLGEAIEKYNWGHSSFTHGVEFAHTWNTDRLFMFHHEPRYDDQRLFFNLQSARWYAKSLGNTNLEIYLSAEGKEYEI